MKKIVLLLPFMIGMFSTTGEAAQTSALRPYEGNIVTKATTKLYRNSQLKQATTIKTGKVYKANGYRLIKGTKYYRVYQGQYKGYVNAKATQTLKAKKVDRSYFVNTKKTYNIWGNLYFNKVKDQTALNQVVYVKYRYDLPNGASYFSLYNQDNKKQWLGYTNDNAFRQVKATALSYKKNKGIKLNLKSNFNIYRSLNGGKPVATTNQYHHHYVLASYRYDFIGRYVYSLYREDGKWIGYLETYGTYQTINTQQQKQIRSMIQKGEALYQKATPTQRKQANYRLLQNALTSAKKVNSKTTVDVWNDLSIELSGRIANVINA